MSNISALQAARYGYQPKLPAVLKNDLDKIVVEFGKATESVADQAELKELFKNTYGKPEALVKEGKNPDVSKEIKVGVILSGGQAPGGHNVTPCGELLYPVATVSCLIMSPFPSLTMFSRML